MRGWWWWILLAVVVVGSAFLLAGNTSPGGLILNVVLSVTAVIGLVHMRHAARNPSKDRRDEDAPKGNEYEDSSE